MKQGLELQLLDHLPGQAPAAELREDIDPLELGGIPVQGEAMGRPGSMEVRVTLEQGQPGEIQIVGDAVVAFRATLELDA